MTVSVFTSNAFASALFLSVLAGCVGCDDSVGLPEADVDAGARVLNQEPIGNPGGSGPATPAPEADATESSLNTDADATLDAAEHTRDAEPLPTDTWEADAADSAEPADTTVPVDMIEPIDADTADPLPGVPLPTRYPTDLLISPINDFVRSNLLAISTVDLEMASDVFMKVGASSTVSSWNLTCFSGSNVELGAYSDLQLTLDFFNGGDAAGDTPFERDTKAAKVGKTAKWAITGSPSPLDTEVDAIFPLFALVHYGTNDMQMGTTYLSAIWSFADSLLTLTDTLIDQGIIPILSTITPRGDKEAANRWVDTYCAVIRGMAQGRQIPLMDLNLAVQPLDGYGLAGDGVHLNTYTSGGSARPCHLTDEALEYGYNVRNFVQLLALDVVRRVVVDQNEALDETLPTEGDGSPSDPIVIGSLPFTHLHNTSDSPYANLNFYSGCEADQNESGPELLYRMQLDAPTRLRALVFDRGSVDVDVHLLDETASEEGCIDRAHRAIEITLDAGLYHFSLDSFTTGAGPQAGEFVFVVVECHPDDTSCD